MAGTLVLFFVTGMGICAWQLKLRACGQAVRVLVVERPFCFVLYVGVCCIAGSV
jgi:uncharacterized membrane protein